MAGGWDGEDMPEKAKGLDAHEDRMWRLVQDMAALSAGFAHVQKEFADNVHNSRDTIKRVHERMDDIKEHLSSLDDMKQNQEERIAMLQEGVASANEMINASREERHKLLSNMAELHKTLEDSDAKLKMFRRLSQIIALLVTVGGALLGLFGSDTLMHIVKALGLTR